MNFRLASLFSGTPWPLLYATSMSYIWVSTAFSGSVKTRSTFNVDVGRYKVNEEISHVFLSTLVIPGSIWPLLDAVFMHHSCFFLIFCPRKTFLENGNRWAWRSRCAAGNEFMAIISRHNYNEDMFLVFPLSLVTLKCILAPAVRRLCCMYHFGVF